MAVIVRERRFRLGLALFLSDVLAVVTSYLATLYLRFDSEWGDAFFTRLNRWLGVRETGVLDDSFREFYIGSGPRIVFFMIVALTFLYGYCDLYAGARHLRRRVTAANVLRANLVALLIFYGYFYLTRNQFHPRSMFATALLINTVLCILFRGWTEKLLRRFRLDDHPAVLAGTDREAPYLLRWISAHRPHGLHVAEQIAWNAGQPIERLLEDLRNAVKRQNARMIILAEKGMTLAQITRVLELAETLDVEVKVLTDRMNVLLTEARLPVDTVMETPLIHFSRPSPPVYFAAKRALSLVGAVFALLVLSPLMLVIALLIRLTSSGPVFFIQDRIGINRRPFRLIKFRTMRDRAEEMQAEMEKFNEAGDALFKMRNDPRVTPLGRFLRRFSLDELPQLFNVLRGDMTLVGPRPLPRRDFENYYEDWHYDRHGGLPGLTCLWQISGRSELSFQNMCILDIYYLRNQSLMMDFKILLRTLNSVLFGRGAS